MEAQSALRPSFQSTRSSGKGQVQGKFPGQISRKDGLVLSLRQAENGSSSRACQANDPSELAGVSLPHGLRVRLILQEVWPSSVASGVQWGGEDALTGSLGP